MANNYDHLMGWCNEPKHVYAAMADLPYPYFRDIYNKLKDTGRGKTLLFTDIVRQILGYYPIGHQLTGDCQNPSALVRMSDGSEKMIKDIVIGDEVITPYGNINRVVSTIEKPYSNKMIKIWVTGYNKPIESTPDHLYMKLPNIGRSKKGDKNEIEWKAISELNNGDYILLPKLPNSSKTIKFDLSKIGVECFTDDLDFKKLRIVPVKSGMVRAKHGKKSVNRYVEFDEKLAWLVGIYSAEGSCDYNDGVFQRITFNLSSKEVLLAEKIKSYIKDIFNFDAIICQVPSKPTVLYVRITNSLIASLFKHLCSGNTYNKKLNNELLLTSELNKIQLLSGWLDGDGHRGCDGVSVSKDLINDYFNIANSLGINPSIYTRKAYKQSEESQRLSICTLQKEKIELQNVLKLKRKLVTKYGKAAKIKKIEIVEPESDFVYCIGVENDHSFICNGYGIHNCVSFGAAYAATILSIIQIHLGKLETFEGEVATEPIYGGSRIQVGGGALGYGQGSVGAWAAKWLNRYATILRKNYTDIDIDLSKYDVNKATLWGNPGHGCPLPLIKKGSDHLVKTISQVLTYEEARDAIYNGYPITVASNQGFVDGNGRSIRDKDGFLRPGGTWPHQMYFCGVKDDNRPGLLCANSWGTTWVSGPKPYDIPDGTFFVDANVVNSMLSQSDSWVYSNYDGYEIQELNLRIV